VFRSGAAVAADVRMRRSLHKGAFLLVEGGFDSRTYRQFAARDCQLVVCDGYANVAEATAILTSDGFPGVAGIIDRDYRHIGAGTPSSGPGLHLTDYRDLEAMLVASHGFGRVVSSLGSPSKIAAFERREGSDVRTVLLSRAAKVGAMRLYAARNGLPLKFRGLPFRRFTDNMTLEIDLGRLASEVRNRSMMPTLDVDLLIEGTRTVLAERHDVLSLVCGHDTLEVMRIGLRRSIGSQGASSVTADRLGQALALGYDAAEWRTSVLRGELKAWEGANPGYALVE
jgi:Protein of unknown function (DUF4435)